MQTLCPLWWIELLCKQQATNSKVWMFEQILTILQWHSQQNAFTTLKAKFVDISKKKKKMLLYMRAGQMVVQTSEWMEQPKIWYLQQWLPHGVIANEETVIFISISWLDGLKTIYWHFPQNVPLMNITDCRCMWWLSCMLSISAFQTFLLKKSKK